MIDSESNIPTKITNHAKISVNFSNDTYAVCAKCDLDIVSELRTAIGDVRF
jgi:hypothetical protein